MTIAPIVAALRRHKLTVALMVLQIAVTCAIVCNAVYLVAQRVERITVTSGLDEAALSLVKFSDLGAEHPLPLHQGDVDALRGLPGVESAAIVRSVPFWDSQHSSGGCADLAAVAAVVKSHSIDVPGCVPADVYSGGPGIVATLGLKLVAGRDFNAEEYVPEKSDRPVDLPAIIVTRAFAARMFPNDPDHAVGRAVYFGGSGIMLGHATRIVGVVAHLHRANYNANGGNDLSVVLPVEPTSQRVVFALRSRPDARAGVMKRALALLNKRVASRHLSADNATTFSAIRARHFRRDTTMVELLLASVLGLLFVTALGIAGLANFWVGQRTRTIGIRRAIGATRGDILRYFQVENFVIVGVGVAFGLVLGVALNLLLMKHYALPRLPFGFFVVGAAALWILGQLAVLSPALRASRVPPVVATRSV